MGSAPPTPLQQKQKNRRPLGIYQFPENIGMHSFLLLFKQYSYSNNITKLDRPTIIPKDSINLPLPGNLIDASTMKVAGFELGLTGALAAAGSNNVQRWVDRTNETGEVDWAGIAHDLRNQFPGAADALITRFIRKSLSYINPEVQKGIQIARGYTFNPFQALAFDGVNLKTHNFEWTLIPSTRQETETIKKIIHTIQTHSHPEYHSFAGAGSSTTPGKAFFKYPSVCEMYILGSPQEYVYQFKPSIVSQVQIDYAGGGEIAFMEGGAPAAIKLSMTLNEMGIWTREDYEDKSAEIYT